MIRKYSMLALLVFTHMGIVAAATRTNNEYEYATVDLHKKLDAFSYKAISTKGFFKERVKIQNFDDLADELGVAVPLGRAHDHVKLSQMLEDAGFELVDTKNVYAGFKVMTKPNESWQGTANVKRFLQSNPVQQGIMAGNNNARNDANWAPNRNANVMFIKK